MSKDPFENYPYISEGTFKSASQPPKLTPVASHGHSLTDYNPEALPEKYRWKGEGEPPAYWTAADGTRVYRSYADYCDD